MSDANILGTRVPDTPIHRASLWLEDLKYPGRREDATVEDIEPGFVAEFIRQCELRDLTPEQIEEAARYYAMNAHRMLIGNRVMFTIPSPAGEGQTWFLTILVSFWLDAWMHGVATAKGKRGRSNQEIAQGIEL